MKTSNLVKTFHGEDYLEPRINQIVAWFFSVKAEIIIIVIIIVRFYGYENHTLRSETNFGSWKLFKNDETCFLFLVKSSFRSQDI